MLELVQDDELETDNVDRKIIAVKPLWVRVLDGDNTLENDSDRLKNKIIGYKKYPTITDRIDRVLEERYSREEYISLLEKILGN